MKDQPKFRAWNRIVKRMSEPATLQEIAQTENVQWHILIWMQSSGFLDKNMKEIYEGDILRYFDDVRNSTFVHAVKKFPTGAFKMDDDLEGETFKTPVSAIHDISEIIGNIYQNENLLQKPA